MTEIDVRHDEERRRFSTVVEGREAYLEYDVVDDTTVDYRYTYTPPELRGRGIAAVIVRVALEWARAEGKRVIPSCSFVRARLDRETAR